MAARRPPGVSPRTAWLGVLSWPARRWVAALAWAGATVLALGIPTVLIPNPVFGRAVPPTAWAWPSLVVTAALAGLLAATYVRGGPRQDREASGRAGVAGGLLTFLAVGCPVCNKVALIALGTTGALQWFAPVQPVLAVAGAALLAWALHRRLLGELACPLPARSG